MRNIASNGHRCPANYEPQVQIQRVRDKIIVMLDHRLERFDPSGQWLGTLHYPRSQPDGIYDRTPHGENSLYWDEEAELLYLVQGFRILAIDIKNNQVSTVFRQNYANIGPLLVHGNELYFRLNSSDLEVYRMMSMLMSGDDLYTEVVRMSLQDQQIERFVVKGYYETLELRSEFADREPTIVLRNY